MAKRRKSEKPGVIKATVVRAREKTKAKVAHLRTRFATGEPRMTTGMVMAGLGGAVAGGGLSYGGSKLGHPTAIPLAVTGAGTAGALLLDGKKQAACIGAAAGGLVFGLATLLEKYEIAKAIEGWKAKQAAAPQPLPLPPAPPPPQQQLPAKRQAALRHNEAQAAFDSARARIYGTPTWTPHAGWGVS